MKKGEAKEWHSLVVTINGKEIKPASPLIYDTNVVQDTDALFVI